MNSVEPPDLSSHGLLDSEKAKTLQGRIRRYTKEWLTFLDHPGLPPTNNLAEQAVRFFGHPAKGDLRQSHANRGATSGRDDDGDSNGQTAREECDPLPGRVVCVDAQ